MDKNKVILLSTILQYPLLLNGIIESRKDVWLTHVKKFTKHKLTIIDKPGDLTFCFPEITIENGYIPKFSRVYVDKKFVNEFKVNTYLYDGEIFKFHYHIYY
jgi:hypothetical protein